MQYYQMINATNLVATFSYISEDIMKIIYLLHAAVCSYYHTHFRIRIRRTFTEGRSTKNNIFASRELTYL